MEFSLPSVIRIITIVGGIVDRLLSLFQFRSVFGRAVKDAEDFVLSLPQWTLIENADRTPRYERVSPRGEKFKHYGPGRVFAEDDVKGAAALLGLIAGVFGKTAVIVSDREHTSLMNKTAIILGSPTINFEAAEYLKLHKHELPIEFVEKAVGGKNTICLSDKRQNENKEYAGDENYDYGVIIRVPHLKQKPNANYIFFVAGLTDVGTLAASNYFSANWKSFRGKPPVFAVVLKVSKARPAHFEVVVGT